MLSKTDKAVYGATIGAILFAFLGLMGNPLFSILAFVCMCIQIIAIVVEVRKPFSIDIPKSFYSNFGSIPVEKGGAVRAEKPRYDSLGLLIDPGVPGEPRRDRLMTPAERERYIKWHEDYAVSQSKREDIERQCCEAIGEGVRRAKGTN
jgi:hypothetical protein